MILFSGKRKENQESTCFVRFGSDGAKKRVLLLWLRQGGRDFFRARSPRDRSVREIREYFIPDFSDWKNHDEYQKASFGFAQDKFWAVDGGFEGGGREAETGN